MRRILCSVAVAIVAAAGPAAYANSPGTPTAAPRAVPLDATRIGDVKLGGTPADTIKRLSRTLGKPDRARKVEGCRLAGEPAGYAARWGALTVYGQGTSTETVRMRSWTLNAGRVPVKVKVSRGLRPGMTAAQVKATGAPTTRLTNGMTGWTMRASGLTLFFTDRTPRRVETITANPYWCE